MQLLANGILRDRYDDVVVGSGIGGLTAAAMLANRGIRVLVIEQHYIPGGCCTCIRRHSRRASLRELSADVEFETDGLLEVGAETLQVKSRPGVYAGGDIIRGAGTIVEAVADGRRAARAMDRVIRGLP